MRREPQIALIIAGGWNSAAGAAVQDDSMRILLFSGLLALVGGAAGLFTVLAISAFHAPAQSVSLAVASVITASVGAVLGGLLALLSRAARPFRGRDTAVLEIGCAVVSAGALAGLSIGDLTWSTTRGLWAGGLAGAASAVAFVPACLAVLDAAVRAERARRGSLVARVDERTIVSTLAVVVAVVSVGAVPASVLGPARASWTVDHAVAAGSAASIAAVVVIALALIGDRRSRRLVHALRQTTPELERRDDDASVESLAQGGAPPDLGLGRSIFARVKRGVAYRQHDRCTVALRGDPELALRAIEDAVRARWRGLVLAGLVVAVHVVAATPSSSLAASGAACERGEGAVCLDAASALASSPGEEARRFTLLRHGCDADHLGACLELAVAIERGEGTAPSSSRAEPIHELACDRLVGASCHWLALRRLHGETLPRDVYAARDLSWRGCGAAHEPSCRLYDALLHAQAVASPGVPSFFERRRLVSLR